MGGYNNNKIAPYAIYFQTFSTGYFKYLKSEEKLKGATEAFHSLFMQKLLWLCWEENIWPKPQKTIMHA